MVTTLAIDPGSRVTGWALIGDHDISVGAFRAVSLIEMITKVRAVGSFVPHWHFAGERPDFYPGQTKGEANKLAMLAIVVGAAAGASNAARVDLYYPKEWKGGVPKEINHRRTIARVGGEHMIKGLSKLKKTRGRLDALDALGIGLHARTRL